jgi:hypothetical protein
MARSASLISTCASFSASANVAADTDGPAAGAVPKVGGAPAGAAAGAPCGPATGFSLRPRHASATPSSPIGARIRNCLREFTSLPLRFDLSDHNGQDQKGSASIEKSIAADPLDALTSL